MPSTVDLRIDVTDAAGLGGPAEQVVTVHLPEPDALNSPPVVLFAFPGGGYARRYYSFDMPGSTGGGQAGFHLDRGWVVVTVDHLGVGESTVPEVQLDFETVAAGNKAVVEDVLARLAAGTVADGYPAVTDPTTLGIGQSMGGCFTIVLQGLHQTFDGVGILGFSGVQTTVPSRPGTAAVPMPWIPRGSDLAAPPMLNAAAMGAAMEAAAAATAASPASDENPMAWAFHWDDEPEEMVAADMAPPDGALPEWRSATTPPCAIMMVAPGAVALEAAAITVPVLLAMGERDVVPDPWLEPRAFQSATDITLYVCPRMAHMHNFASTREQFWSRIHTWGTGVAEAARA